MGSFNQDAFFEKIKAQLSKILNSETFKESTNLREFLHYIVIETLNGDGQYLKQYTIAINAFNRDSYFDPQKDPIVRIQAGRLRQLLSTYYQSEGDKDPILIEIPKGSYIPEFSVVDRFSTVEKNQLSLKLPEIFVFPFKNISVSQDNQYIAEGFTEELITNLSFFKSITTIRVGIKLEQRRLLKNKEQNVPTFSLKGSVRFSSSNIKAVATLYDSFDDHIVWSMDFLEPYELDKIIKLQEIVAHKVATSVADDYGGAIVKKIYAETQKTAYVDIERFNIILILYVYLRNPTYIEYNKVRGIFHSSVKKYPDFGPGWASLSLLLFNNYILGYTPNAPQLLEEATTCARKAKENNPDNQLCRSVYGYSHLVNNELENCLLQMQYAKSLNPRSAYYLGVIGFISSLAGEWEQGLKDISDSFELNPDYPKWYHIATTLYYLKEKQFEESLKESLKIDLPLILWDYVLKSVSHAHNNNITQAESYLNELKKVMPDFFNKPVFYLKMYIKFDDILETVLIGLVKAGLKERSFP